MSKCGNQNGSNFWSATSAHFSMFAVSFSVIAFLIQIWIYLAFFYYGKAERRNVYEMPPLSGACMALHFFSSACWAFWALSEYYGITYNKNAQENEITHVRDDTAEMNGRLALQSPTEEDCSTSEKAGGEPLLNAQQRLLLNIITSIGGSVGHLTMLIMGLFALRRSLKIVPGENHNAGYLNFLYPFPDHPKHTFSDDPKIQ